MGLPRRGAVNKGFKICYFKTFLSKPVILPVRACTCMCVLVTDLFMKRYTCVQNILQLPII
jgi:hypothetical protein